jgi:NADH-quinone oxidoreductase subunit M
MQIPYVLSIITFIPMVVGLALLAFPAEKKEAIRWTALIAGIIDLALCILVYFTYDQSKAGYQFVEQMNWIPSIGVTYYMAVDGLSLPLVLLTGIVMVTGVMISWGIEDRPREFFAFLYILACGVFGVFMAQDLFLLFFFYEIAVFPMYLLIAIWGWKQRREYAAMKLTLFLVIGSLFALVAALAMYFQAHTLTGIYTFDMIAMEGLAFPLEFQRWAFPVVFIGFAILAGMFPFHNWSPDGHVAAPTAVSMFHAGVLMKLGAFAALRVGVMLLPDGAKEWMPILVFFSLVNIVYGAFVAMTRDDLKYMIGYSSVSHMGLVVLGITTLTPQGLTGAGLQMFSHGAMTALFFSCVGMIYDRAHTRQIPELGGMIKKLPFVGIAFIFGGLVSMGMPGFSGFVAEFPIFMGAWQASVIQQNPAYFWIAIISALAIVITAAYILRAVRRVFFGAVPEHFEHGDHVITPIRTMDKVAILILVFTLFMLGVYPNWMAPLIQTGVDNVLRLLGGA